MTIAALNLLRRLTRATAWRPRTPGIRDMMFRAFYRAAPKMKIPLPGVMEVLRYTKKARWGPGKIDVRTMHRATVAELEYFPKQRELDEYEMPTWEDTPPSATPITTAFQYEFTIETRTDSGFGDKFAEQHFKYRADKLMPAVEAKMEFFQEFGHIFKAENIKWDTMKMVARRRSRLKK